jgi:hypothetical protein
MQACLNTIKKVGKSTSQIPLNGLDDFSKLFVLLVPKTMGQAKLGWYIIENIIMKIYNAG